MKIKKKMKDRYVPPVTSIEPMFTVVDVAHILRVSVDQVYKLRQSGQLYFFKNSAGKVVCLESELQRFIDER